MSDNQSQNSDRWGQSAPVTEIDLADGAVKNAEQLVRTLEQQLEEAKRNLVRANGRLQVLKDKPSWKKIFCPQTITSLQQIYTTCMQTGYKYALWNGSIYMAGNPSEGMVDTGMIEGDIP